MLLTSGMRTIPRGTRGDGASALIGPCTTSTSQTGSNFPHQLALSMRHNRNKRAHDLKPSRRATRRRHRPSSNKSGVLLGVISMEKKPRGRLCSSRVPCLPSFALFVSAVRSHRAGKCLACVQSGLASVWRARIVG